MIDIVAVLRAEDAALDFLSVLGEEQHETHILCGDTGERLVLPPAARSPTAWTPSPRWYGRSTRTPRPRGPRPWPPSWRRPPGGPARLWTHSPADTRRSRGRLGRDAADAAGGRPVLHAVGHSPYLQFISDLDRPLDRAGVAAKLAFVNRHCGHLLRTASEEHVVRTGRVHATERFFAAGPEERERLFALLASLDEDAATVDDPWEFTTSAYEAERLDTTVAWIASHCPPTADPWSRSAPARGPHHPARGQGVHRPRDRTQRGLRHRLAARAGGAARVHPESLEELAARPALPGAAYLLIEMLYYGQDPGLLDRLPADLVFVALEPETLAAT